MTECAQSFYGWWYCGCFLMEINFLLGFKYWLVCGGVRGKWTRKNLKSNQKLKAEYIDPNLLPIFLAHSCTSVFPLSHSPDFISIFHTELTFPPSPSFCVFKLNFATLLKFTPSLFQSIHHIHTWIQSIFPKHSTAQHVKKK